MKLPVAELHLHLEGTLEPEFIMDAATRNGVMLPWKSLDELKSKYSFTDLQSFLDLLYINLEVLHTRDDFEQMTRSYLRRAAAAGVRHAEVSTDIQAHTRRGIPIEVVVAGVRAALDASEADYGITTRLIISFLRDRSPVEAINLLTQLLESGAQFDGIGLDSAEIGYPPSLFVELYDLARANGLHVVAHAGEEGPPEYVTDSLDLLHVERIDHGNRSLEDEELIARLVAERIPLTVCPLSNVRLRVVDDLEEHPIRRMLAHGLNVSVHSDDPAYFGGYVDDNIDAIIERCGVTSDELARLARNSIDSSFLDAEGKARLHLEVDVWSAAQSPSR